MKNRVYFVLLSLVVLSCNGIEKETRILKKDKKDAVLVVKIPKAGCPKCQKVIEEGLAAKKGIKQSILNLHTKKVSVVYNPIITNASTIENAINELTPQIPCK